MTEGTKKRTLEKVSNSKKMVEKAVETSHKNVVTREKPIGEVAETLKGPIGLDIGTSHIIVAQNKRRDIRLIRELNAFFTVPVGKFSRRILDRKDINYYERDNLFYVFGYSAQSFANMFNMNTRRPMSRGVLSSSENEGISVIKAILETLVTRPKEPGETLCFGIPGDPIGMPGAVIYHESVLKRVIETLDLSVPPKDRVSTALHIFYDEVIRKLLESLQEVLSSSDKIPKISTPIPIILSGGTTLPKGCRKKFASMLDDVALPVDISEVRLAEDPLATTAKGALIMAMTETT